MKKILPLFFALLLLFTFCACSAQKEKQSVSNGTELDRQLSQELPSRKNLDNGALDDASNDTEPADRKIIKEAYLSAKTENFDDFLSRIKEETANSGGYLQEISVNGAKTRRYAELNLKIPADKFDAFTQEISAEISLSNYRETLSDVTMAYADTESRILALRTEQETLMGLLEKAEDLNSIIKLQDRLSDVRSEIESYESQKKIYDNRISYSTLVIELYEVERISAAGESPRGFWQEISTAFSDNLYAVGSGLRGFFIWLIGTLPYWFPVAGIAAAIGFAVRHSIKKKQKKSNQVQDNNQK